MTDSGFAEDPAEIADQLREDPILVEQMLGNGFTTEVREVLRDKLDDAQLPMAAEPQGVRAASPTGPGTNGAVIREPRS